MRVTQNMTYTGYLNDIMRRQESLYRLSERLSTGKDLNYPSDDPVKASSALANRGLLSSLEQYSTNIESGIKYLGRAEEVLQSAKDVLTRLKELSVQHATGTVGAEDRANAAIEVESLFNQLLSLSNTEYEDRYIFSGYKSSTPAFDTSGLYQGDGNKHQIAVGEATYMTIGIAGGEVFSGSGGGTDVFQTVTDLKNALLANDQAAITSSIGSLDASFGQISDAVSDIGARLSRLDSAKGTISRLRADIEARVSGLEDADLTKVISEYELGRAALQAAVSSAAKVLSINIFDYL